MLLRFNLEILNVWAFSTLSNNTICKRFLSLTVFNYIITFSTCQQLSLIFLFFPVLPCCYYYIIITFSYCQICLFSFITLQPQHLQGFYIYFHIPLNLTATRLLCFLYYFFIFFLVFYFIPLNLLIPTLVAISSSFSFYIITKKYSFYFFLHLVLKTSCYGFFLQLFLYAIFCCWF